MQLHRTGGTWTGAVMEYLTGFQNIKDSNHGPGKYVTSTTYMICTQALNESWMVLVLKKGSIGSQYMHSATQSPRQSEVLVRPVCNFSTKT